MSELDAARDRLLALLDALPPAEGPSAWDALRADARQAFSDAGLPSTRLEEWRYTNVAPLAKIEWKHADRGSLAEHTGTLLADATPVQDLLGALVPPKQNPFADLNTACLRDGAFVHAARSSDVADVQRLAFAHAAEQSVQHPRTLVVAEAGSRLRVVVDHRATGEVGFTNAVTEVHVGENARVDLVLIQREPEGHFHVSNLAVKQERDSRVGVHTLCLGGAWTRNDASVVLAGEGAECTLNGLFLGTGQQVVDNHTLVDHAVPHCDSSELYKGILGGRSRGVFRGRVVVRPDAQKTRAFQSNPNLLVGRGAEIDTKPQLEIYADDVKCSHGSTIGQLSEDALFYLRARGIEQNTARDLLTRAFAAEVLDALPIEGLAEELEPLLQERLASARQEAPA